MAGKRYKMFTAERLALLLLAAFILVWACLLLRDRTAEGEPLPEPITSIDSVSGTVAADSLRLPRKTASKKRTGTKKKKTKKSTGPRDHLREPIPQED